MTREVLCDIAKGDTVTLSSLHATVHLGAHADGPNHYHATAPAIDERDLDFYLGPCQVIHVEVYWAIQSPSPAEDARTAQVARPVPVGVDRARSPQSPHSLLEPALLSLDPRLSISPVHRTECATKDACHYA